MTKNKKIAKKKKKNWMSPGKAAAIGAGAAAIGAGAYYFLGPKGKQHQKKAKALAAKAVKAAKKIGKNWENEAGPALNQIKKAAGTIKRLSKSKTAGKKKE